jgi:hypothetical protein
MLHYPQLPQLPQPPQQSWWLSFRPLGAAAAAIRSVANVMLSNISQYTIHSSIKTLGCTPAGSSVSSFVGIKLVMQRSKAAYP